MNGESGQCARAASSRLRVPLALTPKSVCGSRAAQSCDGCAAVWTTTSIEPACSANSRSTPSASRMSSSCERKASEARVSSSVTGAVEASGPKNALRMSFSIPTHVETLRDQMRARIPSRSDRRIR